MTTATALLNDKPKASEVEQVDSLWAMFNSTTQFLQALKSVLVERELTEEASALARFLPDFAIEESRYENETT